MQLIREAGTRDDRTRLFHQRCPSYLGIHKLILSVQMHVRMPDVLVVTRAPAKEGRTEELWHMVIVDWLQEQVAQNPFLSDLLHQVARAWDYHMG